jgi:hypothetical protein
METSRLNTGLDVLDQAECVRLLGTETVGRLGVVVDGEPSIFPVNFALAGEDIVVRTDPGSKLMAALGGPMVFEVDHLDENTQTGWSVMVHGTAELAEGRPSRTGSQNRVLQPWRQADLPHLLRIVPKTITGRRITTPTQHRSPAADSPESELLAGR